MPIDEILVSALPGDRRAAARAHGRLVRLALDGAVDDVRLGDLLLGRITRLAPSIGGAFVDVGTGRPGILMRADAPAGRPLGEGEAVLVRVVREAEDDKGPKLNARLPSPADVPAEALAGVRPPCRIARGPDLVLALLRRAATPALRRVVVDDAAALAEIRASVPEIAPQLQLWRDPQPLFAAEGVDEAIAAALAPVVALPSGGRLTIERTAALTAIDVDTGAAAGASAKAAALTCDLQAAAELGRQIVLRDLAGLVVVDFVPLRRPAERARVLAALHEALADDDRTLRIGGWTRLGLLELSRERRGPALDRRLAATCLACDGRGRIGAPWWAAGDALRAVLAECRHLPGTTPRLAATPAVLAALHGPLAPTLAAVEARLGCRLVLIEAADLPAAGFRLLPPESYR